MKKLVLLMCGLVFFAVTIAGCGGGGGGNSSIGPFTVTVKNSGSGSVEFQPKKDIYEYTDKVKLIAAPTANWVFQCWEGLGSDGTGKSYETPLDLETYRNYNIKAVFIPKPTLSKENLKLTVVCHWYKTWDFTVFIENDDSKNHFLVPNVKVTINCDGTPCSGTNTDLTYSNIYKINSGVDKINNIELILEHDTFGKISRTTSLEEFGGKNYSITYKWITKEGI